MVEGADRQLYRAGRFRVEQRMEGEIYDVLDNS